QNQKFNHGLLETDYPQGLGGDSGVVEILPARLAVGIEAVNGFSFVRG
ncbi:12984_t:CDS:2, partial [Racocetra persica]